MKMAKGSSALPATPMRSGRIEMEGGPTSQTGSGGRLSSISGRSVSFDESAGGISEAKDEEVNDGAPRPITRKLAGEFDEVAKPEPARDDSGSENEVSDKKTTDETVFRKLPGNRPPMNSSTPAANRVIGRMLDQMMESSDWIRQFTPKAVRQTLWVELSGELAWPVNTMSTVNVAEDTMSLLRAMGLEPQTNPSEAALRDWPPAIAELIGLDEIQRPITLKGVARGHCQGGHAEFVPPNDSSDDDSGEDDYYRKEDAEYDDPSDELALQVREVSEMERMNSTPRFKLATHRPLAQIKAFSGLRNRSENSMQWLRTFVYEMKGTRTPPNEWCTAFELSLRDGALHRTFMNGKTLSMISSSRKNEARLEKPLPTSPDDETALTLVMSGVQSPRGKDIDGTATTDTGADMTVEWTTPVTHPYTTRYAVVEAVSEHTAKAIARFLMHKVVLVYGPMREIMMDSAMEFGSRATAELWKLMQTKELTPVLYRPKLLGLVEKFHMTWKDMVRMHVSEGQDDWDDFLSCALYAYNGSQHATHGFQPNELMMERKLRTSGELLR
ncbi:unnamed protein product [Phytophthora fragariaefolia]|uniref:Unnamed protein product n=1 Tax=Phytophthora fragariaefolia TaxID=1490495 RepID=A0A9W7CQQ8_9STRA|nr:unnamed protein product [Phytophthora fragariaefolia]